jgi:D-xylonolactonase
MMETMAKGYGLVEGPVWDQARGLLFSDVVFGGVFAVDGDGVVSTVFGHRRGIGGMSPHVDGGLVVSGRNISYKSFQGGESRMLLDRDVDNDLVGYNDITTDAAGRVYCGSLGSSPIFDDGREPTAGNLFLIDLDGSARQVAADVHLTNGLGFAPDGKTLYYADSRRRSVFCYTVDAAGDLSQKRLFVETERGSPDGLVVSVDGAVWVALAGGDGVGVYEASGRLREHIGIPTPMCTSVCFGGGDLRDLYIVSGSEGTGSERGGAVHRVRTDVAGLPVPPARVPV